MIMQGYFPGLKIDDYESPPSITVFFAAFFQKRTQELQEIREADKEIQLQYLKNMIIQAREEANAAYSGSTTHIEAVIKQVKDVIRLTYDLDEDILEEADAAEAPIICSSCTERRERIANLREGIANSGERFTSLRLFRFDNLLNLRLSTYNSDFFQRVLDRLNLQFQPVFPTVNLDFLRTRVEFNVPLLRPFESIPLIRFRIADMMPVSIPLIRFRIADMMPVIEIIDDEEDENLPDAVSGLSSNDDLPTETNTRAMTRAEIIKEQDKAYELSLSIDQMKDRLKECIEKLRVLLSNSTGLSHIIELNQSSSELEHQSINLGDVLRQCKELLLQLKEDGENAHEEDVEQWQLQLEDLIKETESKPEKSDSGRD